MRDTIFLTRFYDNIVKIFIKSSTLTAPSKRWSFLQKQLRASSIFPKSTPNPTIQIIPCQLPIKSSSHVFSPYQLLTALTLPNPPLPMTTYAIQEVSNTTFMDFIKSCILCKTDNFFFLLLIVYLPF